MALTIDGTNGIETNTDTGKIKVGTDDDLQIYHDGTNSKLENTTGKLLLNTSADLFGVLHGSDDAIISRVNGAVELYHAGNKKFETTSDGCMFTVVIKNENDGTAHRLTLGAANDFNFYHDGTHSYVDNHTGDLKIRNASNNDTSNIYIQAKDGENSIVCRDNAQVELYYDNQIKFSTRTNGVELHGDSIFKHYGWRANLDRSWGDYPCIGVSPDTSYGNQGEFRFHGDTANNID